ncbi:MarR family transcriptional regulator [Streptomyces atratus]
MPVVTSVDGAFSGLAVPEARRLRDGDPCGEGAARQQLPHRPAFSRPCRPAPGKAAIDDLRRPSATGAQPRVGGTRGSRYGTSGVADQRSGRTIRPGDRVRIGSVSKAFLATVVLTVPEHAAPMNQLSQLMGFSTAGTTKVVDRLCEAGLLERRASCSDRRVTYAALTPVGLSAAADASSAPAAALRRRVAAAGVGTDRFAALTADIALLDPAPGPCTTDPGPDCPGV